MRDNGNVVTRFDAFTARESPPDDLFRSPTPVLCCSLPRLRCPLCGRAARRGTPLPCRRFCLLRQCLVRRRSLRHLLQRATGRARPPGRCLLPSASRGVLRGSLGLGASALGRAQFHSGLAGLVKTDRNGLLGVRRTVFAFADVVHLFPDEFSGLRGSRLTFPLIFCCAFECFFLRHRDNDAVNAQEGCKRKPLRRHSIFGTECWRSCVCAKPTVAFPPRY